MPAVECVSLESRLHAYDTQNINQRAQTLFAALVNAGFKTEQAVGILSSLKYESNLDPTIENKNSKAYGIAQWLVKGAKTRGRDYASTFKENIHNSTGYSQIKFIIWELNNTETHSRDLLLQAKSARAASDVWTTVFERPHNPRVKGSMEREERVHAKFIPYGWAIANAYVPCKVSGVPAMSYQAIHFEGEKHDKPVSQKLHGAEKIKLRLNTGVNTNTSAITESATLQATGYDDREGRAMAADIARLKSDMDKQEVKNEKINEIGTIITALVVMAGVFYGKRATKTRITDKYPIDSIVSFYPASDFRACVIGVELLNLETDMLEEEFFDFSEATGTEKIEEDYRLWRKRRPLILKTQFMKE